MNTPLPQQSLPPFETVFAAQRDRLLRLCAYWSGRSDVAEDLVQETLIEAWRHRAQLRKPEAIDAWLTGIARNVCRRWLHAHGREQARLFVQPEPRDDEAPFLHSVADDFDLEVELERDELATLLDRALALLPVETRSALVAHYVDETPHAQIAQQLGVSEGAVAVRLHRGKLAFRRVLVSHLRQEAQSYGLIAATAEEWEETRIWCPSCAKRHMVGRFDRASGAFTLRCPGCFNDPENLCITDVSLPELHEVKGYKAALNRIAVWAYQYFRAAIDTGTARCPSCGRMNDVYLGSSNLLPEPLRSIPGVCVPCSTCQSIPYTAGAGLVLHTPVVQTFWRQHPRMLMLPDQAIEFEGRSAMLTRIESVADQATLEVILSATTYEVLHVHKFARAWR